MAQTFQEPVLLKEQKTPQQIQADTRAACFEDTQNATENGPVLANGTHAHPVSDNGKQVQQT